MTKRQEVLFRQILYVCDIATLLISYVLAYWIRDRFFGPWYGSLFSFSEYAWILWIVVPTWIFLLGRWGLYDSASYSSLSKLVYPLLQVQIIGGLVVLSTMYLSRSWEVSRLLLQVFLVVSALCLLGEKVGVRIVLAYLRDKEHSYLRNVLIIGTGDRAERYLHLLNTYPHWGARVIGLLSTNGKGTEQCCGKPVLGSLNDLQEVLQKYVVDEVVTLLAEEEKVNLEGLMAACAERGVTFRTLVEMPGVHIGKYHMEDLGGGRYLLSLETVPQRLSLLLVKRVVDIIGAIIGLLLCGVAYIWYRPKVRRESPGSIFFRQTRVGQNGRLFTLYKFRTMYPDAEEQLKDLLINNQMQGYIFKIKDDPRIIPTGHWLRRRHLDELPQFWNVLRGDLSLVGTRPPTPNEVSQYQPHHYRRLSMKPGMTGLWQLNGHVAVHDFEDVVRLDCEYIDNWSLWLDCKIVAKTVTKVIRGEGW